MSPPDEKQRPKNGTGREIRSRAEQKFEFRTTRRESLASERCCVTGFAPIYYILDIYIYIYIQKYYLSV